MSGSDLLAKRLAEKESENRKAEQHLSILMAKQEDREKRQIAAALSWKDEQAATDHAKLMNDLVYAHAVAKNDEHIIRLFKDRKMTEALYGEKMAEWNAIPAAAPEASVLPNAIDQEEELPEGQVMIENEEVYNLINEGLEPKTRDSILAGLSYAIESGQPTNLLVGMAHKESSGGWEKTVGSDTFDLPQNIISVNKHGFDSTRGDETKIYYLLYVHKTGKNTYSIVPTSYEIPRTGTMIMDGMFFKGDTPLGDLKKVLSNPATALV